MNLADLLKQLRERDVRVWADGDRLRMSAPKGALTPELQRSITTLKAELLAWLASSAGSGDQGRRIAVAPRTETMALSFGQSRMWFLNEMSPGIGAYHVAVNLPLADVDIAVLTRALTELVRRHEVLRTTIVVVNGEPAQRIYPPAPVQLPEHDLRGQSPEVQASERERLAREMTFAPFDLARGPLVRFLLIRLDAGAAELIIAQHHLITDGWSLALMLRELNAIYGAFVQLRPSPLAEPVLHYADYAAWQREWLSGSVLERELAYWRGQLQGIAPLELPADRRRPAVQTFRGATQTFQLGGEVSKALKALSRESSATINMTLLAGFGVFLKSWCGQDDLAIGISNGNRTRVELESMLGFFVNTQVLRLDLSATPTFRQAIARVAARALEAHEHQEMPFGRLVEELRPERDLSRSPFCDVLFILQNTPIETEIRSQGGGDAPAAGLPLRERTAALAIAPTREVSSNGTSRLLIETGVSKLDLTLYVEEGAQGFRGTFEYNTDLFDHDTITRALDRFEALLAAAARHPDRRIDELPALTERERESLAAWNATTRQVQGSTWHGLIEAQAATTPDRLAVVSGDTRLSYRELAARADAIAARLQAGGVKRGDIVGLFVERSADMLAAMFAIAKAGAAYLPLDPGFPPDRLAYIVEDAGAAVIVTDAALEATAQVFAVPLITLESATGVGATVQPVQLEADELAYVIYTSGSTGRPKGVEVTHRAVVNFLESIGREPGLAAADTLLAVTTLSFDIAVLELLLPLTRGATVAIASRATAVDPVALQATLAASGARVMQATPVTWRMLLDAGWAPLPGFRAFCGGEALPPELARELLAAGVQLWNLYGPTETTIWSSLEQVKSGGAAISIGRPIANTQIRILDAGLRDVAPGAVGEICISGAGVARGYHHRPELTAERFVPDTTGDGTRLYRTGDRGRWRADGRLECLGRLDHQVKVRGFRIELGEIESVLSAQPGVAQAIVQVLGDGAAARMVAYVVAGDGHTIDRAVLREAVTAALPLYMHPVAYVVLDRMPLTPNGKVDRKALPAPDAPEPGAEAFVAPRGEIESAIAAVWREVLRIEEIGARQNFFELGGHSLLLVQVQAKLSAKLGRSVPVVELFQYPTVEALGRHLGGHADAAGTRAAAQARAAQRTGRMPESVAIVGMAGRFPGAQSIEAFWRNLQAGVESTSRFSASELAAAGVPLALIQDPHYVPVRGVVEDADLFDARFFGYSPREAELLDPQQRVFLECVAEALDRAGYDPYSYPGMIGLYAGTSLNAYLGNLLSQPQVAAALGGVQLLLAGDKDHLPTRVSYKLNLRGPSVNVQTACSTSLVAVHQACRSLLDFECDIALAGGVSIGLPLKGGYRFATGGILSPDGHCRAFDAQAEGTVPGSGCGVVVLKRLSDAQRDGDVVHAIIRGSAINNDGSEKVGYTAPSVRGQADAIALAYATAQVDPASVRYIEAHGTGTALGDPIEIRALTMVFDEHMARPGSCAIGSLKSNVGHMDAAAGVGGLIKAVLAVEHGQLPPSLNYSSPNPQIDFAGSPFRVNTTLQPWHSDPGVPRRAGVSSFGLGGTNAHVVLEEAPARPPSGPSRPWQVLPLSARSRTALASTATNLADHLSREAAPSLADVAYTLQVGRHPFEFRRAIVCQGVADALDGLRDAGDHSLMARAPETAPKTVFMFPGQGTQYAGMGRGLYASEAAYRTAVDQCAEILTRRHALDVRAILLAVEEEVDAANQQLASTLVTQVCLFVTEYALARTWQAWGLTPDALIGHSIGEYVAATIADALTLDDALRLVLVRGDLMAKAAPGAMLAIPRDEQTVAAWLESGNLWLAAVNGPSRCVVAGRVDAVEQLKMRLTAAGIEAQLLRTSGAFHSGLMDHVIGPLTEAASSIRPSAPRIPFISNVTGTWATFAQVSEAGYWGGQLREPVRFAAGVQQLLDAGNTVFVEVGPGQTLGAFVRGCAPGRDDLTVISSLRHAMEMTSDDQRLASGLARAWMSGVAIDWRAYHGSERRSRVELPPYPFDRQRYWIEARQSAALAGSPPSRQLVKNDEITSWFSVPSWTRAPLPTGTPASGEAWLLFADSAGVASGLAARATARGVKVVMVTPGSALAWQDDSTVVLNPASPADYESLVGDLVARETVPRRVVQLWNLDGAAVSPAGDREFTATQQRGFYSLLALVQALASRRVTSQIDLTIVGDHLERVATGDAVNAAKTSLLGLCLVVPQEYPHLRCGVIDLALEPGANAAAAVDVLFAEIAAPSPATAVAYRHGERWIKTHQPLPLTEATRPLLRDGGAYVITGGLGKVGLSIAGHLARERRARLALIGRTGALTDQQKAAVAALQACGSEVLVLAADVADESQLRGAIATATQHFGGLNGVIHGAGMQRLTALRALDGQACEQQFKAKIAGSRALQRVTDGLDLDFVLLTSSLSSVLGGLGMGAYAAANRFLDGLADERQSDPTRWISVNLDAWRFDDGATGTALSDLAMTPSEAVAALARILDDGAPRRVMISTADLGARLQRYVAGSQVDASPASAAPLALHERPELATGYSRPADAVEETISEVWQSLLGIDKIGRHDNFFELGGHSLLLVSMHAELTARLGRDVAITDLFKFPTISLLSEHLGRDGAIQLAAPKVTVRRDPEPPSAIDRNAVAVVGMAGRFPGAPDLAAFWNNLRDGVESITPLTDVTLKSLGVPDEWLSYPAFVKVASAIADADQFDAAFFGYTPRETESIDPQHRVFLECVWEALEHAGYDPGSYPGSIGIYAGAGQHGYLMHLAAHPGLAESMGSLQTSIATATDHLPSRVSYKLNLRGPSVNVQSACSTSLVAVHQACRSLVDGECDIAIAGGVSVRPSAQRGYLYQEDGILSPDGHCRAFDVRAQGTVWGDGVGVVVLKRLAQALADGDTIHAVIRGSAVNNDGSVKVGYTAPGVDGQAAVIARAQAVAGVSPSAIAYVEAHGTGTALGDPIEVAALTQVFGPGTPGSVAIGTLKSNVGHLDAAAGVAGLIKTVLAVKHGEIPASLHFDTPNPKIDFGRSPFFVNTGLRSWPERDGPRLAGVSSFGLGGTNAHAIVEQAIAQPVSGPSRDWQVLVLSARTATALEAAADRLATALASTSGLALADVAYTLQVGRSAMPHRRAIVCRDIGDAVRSLRMKSSAAQAAGIVNRREPSCVLMFSGQGAQYVGMAAELYRDEPGFRADVDACCDLLQPHLDRDLRDVMFSTGRDVAAAELLKQTAYTQPALFVVEYAIARLWMRWGIKPGAFIGHSVGEYVAACLAGVFTLADALPLVAARGRLIQQLPTGAMLAVSASESAILPLLDPSVSIAAVNGPTLMVLSGPGEAIDRQAAQLEAVEIAARRLETSHAFHSAMMEPALDAFRALVAAVPRRRPQVPIVSNLTGDWLSDEQALSSEYWVQHLRQPVRFAAGVERLMQSHHAYIEVGPGRTLATFVRQAAPAGEAPIVVTSLRHPQESHADLDGMLRGVARLWSAGVPIDWTAYWSNEQRRRVELPSYPFERQRFSLATRPRPAAAHSAAPKRRPLADWFSVTSWKRAPNVPRQRARAGTPWLLFADRSGLAAQVRAQLAAAGQQAVVVEMGAGFERLANDHYAIDPGEPQDYRRLLEALRSAARLPTTVGHFWTATDDVGAAAATDADQQRRGFQSLLYFAQALGDLGTSSPLHLAIVTTGLVEVTGDERISPATATVVGPLRVIPQEYPNITCRAVDLIASEWQAPDDRRLADLVSVLSDTRGDPIVAHRGAHQWIPTIEPASFEAAAPGLSNLRERGVYLITGGYGGIGLSLATYLAQGVRARIALVGRSGLPPRDSWAGILSQPPDDRRVVRQIETIQALEAAGAEVLPLIGDVTMAAQMKAAVEQTLGQWGRIDGVVHAAGVPGGGVIQLKRPEVAASVMAPKIAGTRALAQALEGVALDFFVLCSSTTALLGGGGQVDYCAANAFLDAFAGEHMRRTGTPTIAINWDAWREVGMAVETGVPAEVMRRRAAALRDAIAPQEGAEAFARIIAHPGFSQVVVSPFAFVTKPDDETRVARESEGAAAVADGPAAGGYERPDLETPFEAPRNEVEERVAAIWQQMFGIARIGVADDFFALGGHSLLATQVISRTRAEFQIALALEDLFVAPTIAGLSDLVLTRLIEEEEGGLVDVEELSADQVGHELPDQVGHELGLGRSSGESDL